MFVAPCNGEFLVTYGRTLWVRTKNPRLHGATAMKCVKLHSTGEIIRLFNDLAARAVSAGEAEYVPKSQWKATEKRLTERCGGRDG
jgi:hypothetical protein